MSLDGSGNDGAYYLAVITIVFVIENKPLVLFSAAVDFIFAVIAGAFESLFGNSSICNERFLVKGVFLIWLMHYNNIPVVRWFINNGGELIRVLPFALLCGFLANYNIGSLKIGSLLVVVALHCSSGLYFFGEYYYGLKRN